MTKAFDAEYGGAYSNHPNGDLSLMGPLTGGLASAVGRTVSFTLRRSALLHLLASLAGRAELAPVFVRLGDAIRQADREADSGSVVQRMTWGHSAAGYPGAARANALREAADPHQSPARP